MNKPVVIIGLGEMAGVFARGFLRKGHHVFPVLRGMDMQECAKEYPEPELVLVAVAEKDLHEVLCCMPTQWKNQLVLLQNELLPADWEKHCLDNVTVISVWFEKKKGQDAKVIIPSPVYGPQSQLIHDALAAIDIPVKILSSEDELLFELVVKNVYIITTNVAGLKVGGTVGELWQQHQQLARDVAAEVLAIQQAMTGKTFDKDAIIDAMVKAFEGDMNHKCMGRSAPARLQRALEQAEKYGLEVPVIRQIEADAKRGA